MIDAEPFGPPPFTPSNAFILGVMLLAAFILIFYHGEYKRLNHEGANTHLDEDGPSNDDSMIKATTHALINPVHDEEDESMKKVLVTSSVLSSPAINRKPTQESDDSRDFNLVRVGSQDFNGGSNNSNLFAQSSSAVHSSQNIWVSGQ